jgi:hypothetical protein
MVGYLIRKFRIGQDEAEDVVDVTQDGLREARLRALAGQGSLPHLLCRLPPQPGGEVDEAGQAAAGGSAQTLAARGRRVGAGVPEAARQHQRTASHSCLYPVMRDARWLASTSGARSAEPLPTPWTSASGPST